MKKISIIPLLLQGMILFSFAIGNAASPVPDWDTIRVDGYVSFQFPSGYETTMQNGIQTYSWEDSAVIYMVNVIPNQSWRGSSRDDFDRHTLDYLKAFAQSDKAIQISDTQFTEFGNLRCLTAVAFLSGQNKSIDVLIIPVKEKVFCFYIGSSSLSADLFSTFIQGIHFNRSLHERDQFSAFSVSAEEQAGRAIGMLLLFGGILTGALLLYRQRRKKTASGFEE